MTAASCKQPLHDLLAVLDVLHVRHAPDNLCDGRHLLRIADLHAELIREWIFGKQRGIDLAFHQAAHLREAFLLGNERHADDARIFCQLRADDVLLSGRRRVLEINRDEDLAENS